MADQKLMKEILALIQLSPMDAREKAMWMMLIPQMEEKQVLKLKKSLQKETDALNDMLLKGLTHK